MNLYQLFATCNQHAYLELAFYDICKQSVVTNNLVNGCGVLKEGHVYILMRALKLPLNVTYF